MTSNVTMMRVPLSKLRLDPNANMRKRKPSTEDDAELEASIRAIGVFDPLLTKHAPDGEDAFLVSAGGRRLRALQKIHGADSEERINCAVMSDTPISAMEASMLTMRYAVQHHPADRAAAFQYLIDTDHASVEDVARRFSMKPIDVRRALTLGRLSPKIMAMFRKDEITEQIAQALTLAASHEQQEKIISRLKKAGKANAFEVRRAILGDRQDTGKLLGFITREAYERMGGVITEDLFQDDATPAVSNRPLLQKMVDDKKEGLMLDACEAGFGWAAFEEHMPSDYHLWTRISGTLSKEQKAKCGVVLILTGKGEIEQHAGWVKPADVKKTEQRSTTAKGAVAERKKAGGLPRTLVGRLATAHARAVQRSMVQEAGVDRRGSALADVVTKLVAKMINADLLSQTDDAIVRALPAIAEAIQPKIMNAELRKQFDSADYFGSAPANMVLRALAEMDRGAIKGVKKAKLAELAAKTAKQTGWLPKELRAAGYDGPGSKPKTGGKR